MPSPISLKPRKEPMSEIINQSESVENKPLEDIENKLSKSKSKVTIKTKTPFELKKEKDLSIVRGRFEFTEISGKGAPLEFSYGSIYQDVAIKKYVLVDSETYELPYMVAKHLNESGKYPVNQYMQDERGKSHMKVGSYVRRYNFVPLFAGIVIP